MPFNSQCEICGGVGWTLYSDSIKRQCPECRPEYKPRSSLRKFSKKKQRQRYESDKLRQLMKQRIGMCENCEKELPEEDIEEHHIAAGSHRRELANPRTLMYLCGKCHHFIQNRSPEWQARAMDIITRRAINQEFGREEV